MARTTRTPLGRAITRYREALGLSQADLGARLGVGPSRVSKLEAGAVPTPKMLEQLPAALEVDAAAFRAEARLPSLDSPPALSPARLLLLSVVADLGEEQIEQVARSLRTLLALSRTPAD